MSRRAEGNARLGSLSKPSLGPAEVPRRDAEIAVPKLAALRPPSAGARILGVLGMLLLCACGGGTAKQAAPSQTSMERLEGVERELGNAPSKPRPEEPPRAAQDPSEAEAIRAMLARARELRAKQDAEHAALPAQDEAQLLAFAERYRPAKEVEAGAVEHYLYGRALLLAGRSSEARYRYEVALRHQPRFSLARAAMGLWHFRFEEWAEAQTLLAEAWAEDRSDPEVAFYLAYTHDKLGQSEKAYTLMVEALAAGRGEEPAALWLAEHHAKKEESSEVVRILEPVVAKHPENDQLRLRLAAAYEELGRLDDSIRQLQEILPRLQGGWLQMVRYAELLRRGNRFEEAEAVFRRVLAEAPPKFFAEDLGPQGKQALEDRLELVMRERAAGRKLQYTREELLTTLRNPQQFSVEQRIDAAQKLTIDRPPADNNALGQLVTILVKDPDPRVRIWAPRVLQAWAVPEQAERFLIWLARNEKEQTNVRAACCEAFEPTASDASVDVLLDCLGGEPLLFHASDAALERITGQIVVVGDGAYLDEKPESRLKKQQEWREKVARWRERRAASTADGSKLR
ncbi:MAG: tetratricopeptide repeat protein [Planctomycetes bacterium]|nr:tetratricopeptide repeat protein [Planctomycetota bacterium]